MFKDKIQNSLTALKNAAAHVRDNKKDYATIAAVATTAVVVNVGAQFAADKALDKILKD